MSLFFVDSSKDVDLFNQNNCSETELAKLNILKENVLSQKKTKSFDKNEDEDMKDYFGFPPPSVDLTEIFNKYSTPELNRKSKIIESVEQFAAQMGWRSDLFDYRNTNKNKIVKEIGGEAKSNCDLDKIAKTDVEKEMKGAVSLLGHDLARFSKSDKQLQNERRVERSKTKGPNWFNLPATEVTDEIKNDLQILQMRSALDPKHFYKKNDLKVLPKYFQVGTVLKSPLDYYNERDSKTNKKRTMVEELMADAEFQKFNKRKYKEVVENKKKTAYHKAHQKMKKLKKKK